MKKLSILSLVLALALATPTLAQERTRWRLELQSDEGALVVVGDELDVEATLGGVALPSHLLRRNNSWCEVLAPSTRTLAVLGIPQHGILHGSPPMRLDLHWVLATPTSEATKKIGIAFEPVGEALAAQLQIEPGAALVVTSVDEGGAAARAGVRRHDVIRAVGGESPVDATRLRNAIQAAAAGASIRLTLVRALGDIELEVGVELGSSGGPAERFWGLYQDELLQTRHLFDAADSGVHDRLLEARGAWERAAEGSRELRASQHYQSAREALEKAIEAYTRQQNASSPWGASALLYTQPMLDELTKPRARAEGAEGKPDDRGAGSVEQRLAAIEQLLERLLEQRPVH